MPSGWVLSVGLLLLWLGGVFFGAGIALWVTR